MQVPIFKAKDLNSEEIVEGFYCEYPITSTNDNIITSNIVHCIFTYKPSFIGMINDPVGCTIDLATLEFVKFIEIPCKAPKIIM